jgi:hypothetical protein
LTKEWFEDSSSEDEAEFSQNCYHVRLFKKGKTSTLARRSDSLRKDKDLMVELRVKVKIELKVVSTKAVLMANVSGGLKNAGSSTSAVDDAVTTLPSSSQSTKPQQKKKKSGKAENNWRERPIRARPHGPFQRTLPGELSRAIILARVNNRQTIPLTENTMSVPIATLGGTTEADAAVSSNFPDQGTGRTRKEVKAARKIIKETKGLEIGLLREHPSLSMASHTQVANVIAKCLPLQSVAPFMVMFNNFRPPPLQKRKKQKRKKGNAASVPIPPAVVAAASALGPSAFCDEKICKTPIQWVDSSLKHVFGTEYVMLKRCKHPDEMYSHGESHSDLDLIVMDCVLSRSGPMDLKRKRKDDAHACDSPVHVCLFDDVDAVNLAIAVRDGNAFSSRPSGKKNSDNFYRACIVLLPQAGIFYCHRERRSRSTGVLNSHVPMDINWLRLQHDSHGNFFGDGSYVSHLANADKCSIWKWTIRRSATNLLPIPNAIMGVMPRSLVRSIHCTKQLMDEEGPGLPPDYVVGEKDELLSADHKFRAETFQDAFSRSRSAKRGGRHYAPGFLHKTIDPLTTFVINPIKYGELDLHVDVTVPANAGEVAFHRCSVVQIRYLPNVVGSGCEDLLTDINRHCNLVRKQKSSTGARAGNGDLGSMHPIGSRITKCWNKVPYVTSSTVDAAPVLLKAVQAAAKLASVTIPAALRVMQDLENDSEMKHVGGMDGGMCRVTHSMDLSINLANSTHYDVNDASQGFTIWTEDHPGTTEDWYFVLPNMKGKFPGSDRDYNGIAIKLSDGVLIGWDGRLIRHGTSMTGSRSGNIYGTFFAPKTRIIMYGMSQLPMV